MPLDAPIRLGRFLVDGQGRLSLPDPQARPTLDLQWQGLAVRVQVAAAPGDAAEQAGRLSLSAVIGRVPSTAGQPEGDSTRRATALRQLADLGAAMGDGWGLALLPDHRASLQAARDIPLPASAGALLTQVTCFLLDLAPYLDWAAESGLAVEPVGRPISDGTEKTCPG